MHQRHIQQIPKCQLTNAQMSFAACPPCIERHFEVCGHEVSLKVPPVALVARSVPFAIACIQTCLIKKGTRDQLEGCCS